VFLLKADKVLCFDTLLEVFILKGLRWRQNREKWQLILKGLEIRENVETSTGPSIGTSWPDRNLRFRRGWGLVSRDEAGRKGRNDVTGRLCGAEGG